MNFKISISCILLLIITKYANAKRSSKPVVLLSPININTAQVTPSFDFAEISVNVFILLLSAGTVQNTGTEISFPLSKKMQMSSLRITFNNVTYVLAERHLLINQNGSQQNRSGHTINDKGFPIEGVNIFVNILKYGNLKEAKKHHDGIIVLSQPVDLIDIPNPTFKPFENLLRSSKLKTPNSAATFSTLFSFIWFDSLLKNRAYFMYKGSLYDPETQTYTPEVTQILTQPPLNFISYEQFTAFKNVLDNDGNPLNNIAPLNPVKGRKIKAVKGFFVKIRPFDVPAFVPKWR